MFYPGFGAAGARIFMYSGLSYKTLTDRKVKRCLIFLKNTHSEALK